MNNKHIGSDFDDFLQDEGIHQEVTEVAKSRVIKLIHENETSFKQTVFKTKNILKMPTQK